MQLSLNEIQVECRKAARGVGQPWGLAEETGRAVAWLAERGIDALPALLDCLAASEVSTDPIAIGTGIADQAATLESGGELAFAEIRQPVLVLPFIALAARVIGRAITVTHAGGVWPVLSDGLAPAMLAEVNHLAVTTAITCRAGDQFSMMPSKRLPMARLDIDEAIWQRLQDLAHHTYVPATEQSRLLGAGAGSIDND
jgi:hypothetical protein